MIKPLNLKYFLSLSSYLTNRPDYLQGAGGNISEKIDDELMLIKSSGIEIKEINENYGFSVVKYRDVSEKFSKIPLIITKEQDESMVSFINDQTIKNDKYNLLRPSIETGFHSILKKYVIHTHSVYANIITCSNRFEELIEKLFKNDDFITIPYFPPGTILTKNILKEYNSFFLQNKKHPRIIFLKNHGLIVHASNSEEAINLHEYTTKILCDFLEIDQYSFPNVSIKSKKSAHYESSNLFLLNIFRKNKFINQDYFNQTLFPDQTVYFKENISFESSKNKKVLIQKDKIIYFCNLKEAKTIEETLIAYIFIRKNIERAHLKCSFISQQEMNYIHDLESEKYRKKMLKK